MSSRYRDENGVLYNKLGINDAVTLASVEYDLTSLRSKALVSGAIALKAEDFGLDRLKEIHLHVFQDVFEWAGQLRLVPSSKLAPNGMVTVFEDPQNIGTCWNQLAGVTHSFVHARDLDLEQQRKQLVAIYVEANRIHPFPEGNGRSLQIFMRQLATEQGLQLDFTRVRPHEWNMACALSCTHGHLVDGHYLIPQPRDDGPLRAILTEVIQVR